MSIRIHVDPTNPGQFFACCGLLELANRLWGEAEGWFEKGKGHFCIESRHLEDSVDHTQGAFTNEIAHCTVRNTMTESQLKRRELLSSMAKITVDNNPLLKSEKQSLDGLWREAPVLFGSPFNLRIDWFLDDLTGGSVLKTWAGQQSVVDIAIGMRSSATADGWDSLSVESWLLRRSRGDCLPFNFDSDLGSIGGDRDVGFSFDPLRNINVDVNIQTRPLIELLAFIGLQRFRPIRVRSENRFQYCLWFDPMLPEVASAAVCGLLDIPNSQLYEFRLLYRTKYLKSFLSSTPISRSAL